MRAVVPCGRRENVSGAPSALSALSNDCYVRVMVCFYCDSHMPRAGPPLTALPPAASLCAERTRYPVREQVAHAHTVISGKLTASSQSQVKCCSASPSSCPPPSLHTPPFLSSPLLISLTPKDKRSHCTMGCHLSQQEQLLETFHCQKISSQFFLPSLSLSPSSPSTSLTFVLALSPSPPSLLCSALPFCMAAVELRCRSDSH